MPVLDGTLSRLKEVKDHRNVFADSNLLGECNIVISDKQEQQFIMHIYRPYIQCVIDCISSRRKSSDLVSAFSAFDP